MGFDLMGFDGSLVHVIDFVGSLLLYEAGAPSLLILPPLCHRSGGSRSHLVAVIGGGSRAAAVESGSHIVVIGGGSWAATLAVIVQIITP